jgi:isocitrate dehydrogenase kinase/phosphatase
VFPENWVPFLLGDVRIRAALLRHHADLFTADFWQERKDRILGRELVDIFPYPPERRFETRFGTGV